MSGMGSDLRPIPKIVAAERLIESHPQKAARHLRAVSEPQKQRIS